MNRPSELYKKLAQERLDAMIAKMRLELDRAILGDPLYPLEYTRHIYNQRVKIEYE